MTRLHEILSFCPLAKHKFIQPWVCVLVLQEFFTIVHSSLFWSRCPNSSSSLRGRRWLRFSGGQRRNAPATRARQQTSRQPQGKGQKQALSSGRPERPAAESRGARPPRISSRGKVPGTERWPAEEAGAEAGAAGGYGGHAQNSGRIKYNHKKCNVEKSLIFFGCCWCFDRMQICRLACTTWRGVSVWGGGVCGRAVTWRTASAGRLTTACAHALLEKSNAKLTLKVKNAFVSQW